MERIEAERIPLSVADAALPGLRTIVIAPWGRVVSAKGEFVMDEQAAETTVNDFNRHGVAVPIDIEHESIDANLPAARRGAIGWVEKLWPEPGRGMMGMVRWGDRARELIRDDSFRYLSPVLSIRKDDRRVVGLHSAALTCKPAIPRMERLAASANADKTVIPFGENRTMELLETLKNALGMEAEATSEAVLQAAIDRAGKSKADATVANSVRARLGLGKDAYAAMTLIAFDARCVGAAHADQVSFADALVNKAIADNKIGDRDKERIEFLHTLALSDRKTAEAFVENLTPFPYPVQGRTTPPKVSATGNERCNVITRALNQFRSEPGHGKLTSERAFIDLALRESGLSKTTEEDIRSFHVAV